MLAVVVIITDDVDDDDGKRSSGLTRSFCTPSIDDSAEDGSMVLVGRVPVPVQGDAAAAVQRPPGRLRLVEVGVAWLLSLAVPVVSLGGGGDVSVVAGIIHEWEGCEWSDDLG